MFIEVENIDGDFEVIMVDKITRVFLTNKTLTRINTVCGTYTITRTPIEDIAAILLNKVTD